MWTAISDETNGYSRETFENELYYYAKLWRLNVRNQLVSVLV